MRSMRPQISADSSDRSAPMLVGMESSESARLKHSRSNPAAEQPACSLRLRLCGEILLLRERL